VELSGTGTTRVHSAPMTSKEQRALERSHWTGRLVRGPDPGDAEALQLTPEEAWVAVQQLTRSLWLLSSGNEELKPRAQWPARLFRPGQERDDADGP
jgi:hypothetical protein